MHHKGRNRHHWEYWTDYSQEAHAYLPVPMPRRYLAEMICDRMAAGKTYRGEAYRDRDPLDYLMRSKMRSAMHPETERTLRRFLTLLAEEGETAMFASLRAWLREEKETT